MSGSIATTAQVHPTAIIYPNATVGERVWIGPFVVIGHPRSASIRDALPDDQLAPVHVDRGSVIRSGSVLYEGVSIGRNVQIAHHVIVREDSTVGPDSYLMPFAEIHAEVKIGRDCRVRGFVCNRAEIKDGVAMMGLMVHDYRSRAAGHLEESPVVGSGSVVGMNAVVVGGVVIGRDVTIGAGTVVNKDVRDGETFVGQPARSIEKEGPNEYT